MDLVWNLQAEADGGCDGRFLPGMQSPLSNLQCHVGESRSLPSFTGGLLRPGQQRQSSAALRCIETKALVLDQLLRKHVQERYYEPIVFVAWKVDLSSLKCDGIRFDGQDSRPLDTFDLDPSTERHREPCSFGDTLSKGIGAPAGRIRT